MEKRRNTGGRNRARAQRHQNKAAMLSITLVVCILLAVLLYEGHSLKIKIAANERKTVQLEQQIEEENQRTADIRELQEENIKLHKRLESMIKYMRCVEKENKESKNDEDL